MCKNIYLCISLVNYVEYVETEKEHFVHKISNLDLKRTNKEIYISDGKSRNREISKRPKRR